MSEVSVEALHRRLAELEAKEEIRAFIAEYCARNDAIADIAGLVGMFAADAVMRNPAGSHNGREAIHTYYKSFFAGGTKFARHHVINQVITVVAPGLAHHDAYFIAMLGREGESKVIFGRYADTLVQRDERWWFQEKINDIVAPTTVQAGWAEGFGTHEPLTRSR